MKTLNIGNIKKAKQKGFTIIELVVVILLLGILTATALPRFMDISDEAHQAVVDATLGSFRTGLALYRAQWMAEGQPDAATAVSYDGSDLHPEAGGSGYPGSAEGTFDDEDDCLAIMNGLITFGGLTSAAAAFDGDAEIYETNIEAVSGANDWVATESDAVPTDCVYYYTGQYKSGTSTVPAPAPSQILTYDISAGTVTLGAYTFNQD